MTTLVITLIAYYVFTLAVGLAKTRHQSAEEFITPANTIGAVPTMLSLLGTIVGGGMFLGIAQLGFESIMSALALGVAYLVGSIIFGLMAPALRKFAKEHNVRTLFGVFDTLYSKDTSWLSVSRLFVCMTLLVFFLMLAVQFIGIATFFAYHSSLHLHTAIMMGASIVAVLSTLIYSIVGGFKRDVYTDIVQVVMIVAGLAPVILSLFDADIAGRIRALPSEAFEIGLDQLIFFIGSLLFVAPTFIVRFDLWQRAIAAKDDSAARRSFISSGVASFLFFLLFGFIGLFARAEGLTDSQFVGLEAIDRIVPENLIWITTIAFFAAVMSSADTFLGVAGLALARGTVYKKGELESQQAGTATSVSKLRRMAFAVGIASFLLAYILKDIVDLFASAFGILMVFLPALIGGLTKKNPGLREARISVIAGLIVVIPLIFVIPTEAFLPGIVVSTATYLILARGTSRGTIQSNGAIS